MTTTRTAWLLLSALGALPACSSTDALQCGEGTVEVDGACVAADTDASPGSTGSDPGAIGTDSAQTSAGGKSGDEPDPDGPSPYAACPGGSDVECVANEQCDDALGMCIQRCSRDTECSDPADGTAVQRCEDRGTWGAGICVLYCGADGFDCPTGMSCQEISLCEDESGGTWGTTTGGGCDNATLEICMWD